MTTTNFTQISNTKKALAALALVSAMIVPYMLLADTSSPSCSTNPPAGFTDKDCDGNFFPNSDFSTGIDFGDIDLDDNDTNVGSIKKEMPIIPFV